ncbi:MAG: alpha-2-macroglobulin family protein [Magnetococcales bacterium]|nr:alpha-2-macroglobulin family protein [Magnetococcales bacterium]
MATPQRKFQFFGRLSLLFLALLTLPARSAAEREYGLLGIQESGYVMAEGDTFFLLADTGFTSREKAVIRLEGPSWALHAYTGVDILVYRIPDPLEFLRKQSNLHRVRVPGRYDGEGLANAMNYVWDVWYKKSRLGWQRIFAPEARTRAVAREPRFKQAPAHTYKTRFEDNPQYAPLTEFPLLSRFRYPLWQAKPIQPPGNVKVAGSSHEFVRVRKGNVPLPLGELSPGLYLVEGLLGTYRAVTLVFVSDTAAITKTSGHQLFVWTADKQNGTLAPGTQLLLTDGAGTLQSQVTGNDGTAVFDQPTPERSYLIARDRHGGVHVSENFYYDSEIHNAKLFAFTDRPLYRPGDTVRFKLVGRRFQDARQSELLKAGPIHLTALDPTGAPVASTTFHLDPAGGGDGAFQLPDQAPPGGYTLRLIYRNEPYAASFRVANYARPHYDIDIHFDKKSFKTRETLSGVIRARHPGGQPVVGLNLELSLRAQTLAMSDYEHRQQGRFPVQLTQTSLTADQEGSVRFTLPPVEQPSRLTLRVVGSDATSYRVSAIRDLLVEAETPPYRIETGQRITQPGAKVKFTVRRPATDSGGQPVTWLLQRLEGGVTERGTVQGDHFFITFDKPGSYQIELQVGEQRNMGTLAHWVAGEGMKTPPDKLSMVLDKDSYRPGETVQALLTFPAPVQEALLTLERDRVYQHGFLSRGADWLRLTRRTPTQWEAAIPVTTLFQPNLTLSVAVLQDGKYYFQNKGIRVENAPIAIALTPDRPVYRPGERVTVEMRTTVAEKPVAAQLAVGVVDEMVYVLQPELAPDIRDFFGHWRRNQVRTLSSLNFFTYDQAIPARDGETPARFNRPVKLLERPRRENLDTAAWLPRLRTDEQGRGRFSFIMPDSLTRWRITARATTPAGEMGQQSSFLVSEKPAYLKWSGPTRFRQGDEVNTVLMAFNMAQEAKQATLQFGDDPPRELRLVPGVNHISLSFKADADRVIDSVLTIDNQVVDRLETRLGVVPNQWRDTVAQTVALTGRTTRIHLPSGARDIRVILTRGVDSQLQRVAAGLVEYPYGCVEQSASRLIPLALAYGALRQFSPDPALLERLRDRLSNQRFRLAQMAGPDAGFTWWGAQTRGDPFFTAYAYFADHLALTALGLDAPQEHWLEALQVYHAGHAHQPLLLRALALWLAGEMRLPVRNQATGVAEALLKELHSQAGEGPKAQAGEGPKALAGEGQNPLASQILSDKQTPQGRDFALLLLEELLGDTGNNMSGFTAAAQEAGERIRRRADAFSQALHLLHRVRMGGKRVAEEEAATILANISEQAPTLDRALALIFVHRALGGGRTEDAGKIPDLEQPWIRQTTQVGSVAWHHPGPAGNRLEINLAGDPLPDLTAYLTYSDPQPLTNTIDLDIRRQLYLLTPVKERPKPDYEGGKQPVEVLFQARRVAPGEPLDATALYLDAITLDPHGVNRRFGLLEVPLPPGAELEPFTWGMGVQGVEEDAAEREAEGEGEEAKGEPLLLPKTHAEMIEGSYVVPVPDFARGMRKKAGVHTFRHLVRFPLRGSMNLPPVRYFSMVNPGEHARGSQPPVLVIR